MCYVAQLWLYCLVIGLALQPAISSGSQYANLIRNIFRNAATSLFTKNQHHPNKHNDLNRFFSFGETSDDSSSSWTSFKNNTTNETAWDYVESVRQDNLDAQNVSSASPLYQHPSSSMFLEKKIGLLARILGVIVVKQTLAKFVSSNPKALVEIASLLFCDDTLDAVNTIRSILASVQSEHGVVVHIFGRYKRRDILASVLALSRLQHASHYYQWNSIGEKQSQCNLQESNLHNSDNFLRKESMLIKDIAHYSIYANAAYGWKMDLAFRQRFHFGGNYQVLLRRTGIAKDDVVKVRWESRAHRPAYFCVRDRKRKVLVLCIRGTWSAHDLLTDLCCAPETIDLSVPSDEDYILSTHGTRYERTRRLSVHGGMLKAARLVQEDVEPVLRHELENAGRDFSLILVGHSMGGSVAALLGILLKNELPDREIRVYTYGASCVSPINTNLFRNVVSVMNSGDPFSSLSLGHVADVSVALAQLCEDPLLRNQVLLRTNAAVSLMETEDLEWCYEQLKQLRLRMTAEKFFPPGRIILLSENNELETSCLRTKIKHPSIREVQPEFFEDLLIGARMFDLSRHIPSLYESHLRRLAKVVDLTVS